MGAKYWKSLNEWAESPEFEQKLKQEFPAGAAVADETDRREFLKLMGASLGLAGLGLTGCRQPENYILPYADQPENIIPGVPLYYASSQPSPKGNIPLVVETHQARPTKVEGNPSYKRYAGATDKFAQASILDLYDVDRSRDCLVNGSKVTRQAVLDNLAKTVADYAAKGGRGLAFLADESASSSRRRLVAELKQKLPEAIWAEYEPVNYSNAEKALQSVLGARLRPNYRFNKAKRILAVDSDFLAFEPNHIAHSKEFADGRRIDDPKDADKMNRLYAVESQFTLTGGMADHRLRVATAHAPAFIARVAATLLKKKGGAADLVRLLESKSADLPYDQEWIDAMVDDLLAHPGESLVAAGSHLPVEAHAIAFAINQALGAEGETVEYLQLPDSPASTISELAAAANAGNITTLVVLGGNPAYNAPADIDWAALTAKVARVIRYGYHVDETSAGAHMHIAATHYLESWSDGETYDGAYVPVQPMILPLFANTFSQLEFLAFFAGYPATTEPYEIVRATFNQKTGKKDDLSFNAWLREGVVEDTAYQPFPGNTGSGLGKVASLLGNTTFFTTALSGKQLEVRIAPSAHTFDGRYANNGWLQEVPDPMSKLTWDNAIYISPQLAEEMNIAQSTIRMNEMGALRKTANDFKRGQEVAPLVQVKVGDTMVTGPAHVMPGLADYTLVVQLGYGRKFNGRIIEDEITGTGRGFDVYPLMTLAEPAVRTGATIALNGKTYKLANTQEHWSMEGRAIIRENTTEGFKKDPEFVDTLGAESHSPPIYGDAKDKPIEYKATETPRGGSLYDTPNFTAPQQWGMSIDLNTCTGCNACVIACQSENNIPIVGKDQVLRGREMHWIRLDRYYSSGEPTKREDGSVSTTTIPRDPQVSFMGVACAHCELAPCESVCPVNATVHDEQGLNVMAYNRCVGTRYCANNCPYKVRRFNFFDYNKRELDELYKGPLGEKQDQTLVQMGRNPDVTVRMRGVMEKCTYCVQRIEEAKIHQLAKAKGSNNIEVPDGTIRTACQQVCPTQSIQFGDITDTNSEVYKAKMSPRDYSLLGYLNIRPRTTYLAKLRNPNPEMPEAYQYDKPHTYTEYKDASFGSKDDKASEPAEAH